MNLLSIEKLVAIAGFTLALSAIASLYAQSREPEPSIVSWNEGEILYDHRGRTNSINVSPLGGSANIALSTQDMPPGSGIAVHRHDRTEEILFIHAGQATLIFGDEKYEVTAGDTIYVPPGTYHGLENPNSNVRILGIVTPPGLEQAFREMFWHAGEEPKVLSEDELKAIGLEFDAVLRPN